MITVIDHNLHCRCSKMHSKIKISPAVLITPMTDLSSDVGPSRKNQFYCYFSPRNIDGIWFLGEAILNFKLVPWCLDIFWLLLTSSVSPAITHILAKNSRLCPFLFVCCHLFFFNFSSFLFFNSEETVLGEMTLNESVT